MKYLKYISSVLIGSIVFASCIKTVELDFEVETKPTFNCILNPDSTIKANLTESRAIDGTEEIVGIENAKIRLLEEDKLIGILTDIGSGNYIFNYFPESGKTYSVEINVNNYPVLIATTTVPEQTKFKLNEKPVNDGSNITVEIHDEPGPDFYWYYSYSIANRYGYKYISTLYSLYSPYFDDFNKQIEPESRYGYQYLYMIRISDQNSDGKVLEWEMYNRISDIYDDYRIFMTVDRHYDQYLKTSIQMRMQENQTVALNEPVPIYSNVENGYGVFGSNVVTIQKY
ncbi:MAG: DUF4249 domain-containing protein [Bacteroidota bacterium]